MKFENIKIGEIYKIKDNYDLSDEDFLFGRCVDKVKNLFHCNSFNTKKCQILIKFYKKVSGHDGDYSGLGLINHREDKSTSYFWVSYDDVISEATEKELNWIIVEEL